MKFTFKWVLVLIIGMMFSLGYGSTTTSAQKKETKFEFVKQDVIATQYIIIAEQTNTQFVVQLQGSNTYSPFYRKEFKVYNNFFKTPQSLKAKNLQRLGYKARDNIKYLS